MRVFRLGKRKRFESNLFVDSSLSKGIVLKYQVLLKCNKLNVQYNVKNHLPLEETGRILVLKI